MADNQITNLTSGYGRDRFINAEVNEELICSICMQVLRRPVMCACEHFFCNDCISAWLASGLALDSVQDRSSNDNQLISFSDQTVDCETNSSNRCPISGEPVQGSQLRPVPRIVKNLLSKLQIRCEYQSFGCTQVCWYDQIDVHESDCAFNPDRLIGCDHNCGAWLKRSDQSDHDCVQHLVDTVKRLQQQILNMASVIQSNQEEVAMLKQQMDQHC